jgi:hypothetical protein
MTTITYANLQTILNITLTAATCEVIIDHAVNLLNAYGADLPNMTGAAGSKTLSCESREAGAIMEVACSVYNSKYLTSGGSSSSLSIGSLSQSQSTSTGGSAPEAVAKDLAHLLLDIETDVG